MNTNGNIYTVIYTTVVVVVVAAVLAFVSETLKPKQEANVKADAISQMLTASKFYEKSELDAMSNEQKSTHTKLSQSLLYLSMLKVRSAEHLIFQSRKSTLPVSLKHRTTSSRKVQQISNCLFSYSRKTDRM